MSFFGIGKKNDQGKQVRVEHRGRFLRASRTGGLSLRAQAKAAGLSLTANSRHGFRVSHTVGKNTQVALQNGRFVLRGRYGKGPTKLNLSKSGVTVSTRNALGTLNWIKPKRSSATLLGVQVRGQNALYLHAIYGVLALAFGLLRAALELTRLLILLAWALAQLLWHLTMQSLRALPYGLAVLGRSLRNQRLRFAAWRHRAARPPELASWGEGELLAATLLVLQGWGRGQPLGDTRQALSAALATNPASPLGGCAEALGPVAEVLERWRAATEERSATAPALHRLGTLATLAAERIPPSRLPEALLAIDDLLLQAGAKTRFQEQLLRVFCDFAALRLVGPEKGEGQ